VSELSSTRRALAQGPLLTGSRPGRVNVPLGDCVKRRGSPFLERFGCLRAERTTRRSSSATSAPRNHQAWNCRTRRTPSAAPAMHLTP